ncbi:hypothetical protein PHISP_08352, partial [Aspergillus sp. HF37]
PAPATSLAGYTTHPPLRIANRYYQAEIPIWVDEIGPERTQEESTEPGSGSASGSASGSGSSSSKWKDDFLSQDADVVRDAIGGVVICVHNPGFSSSLTSFPATAERETEMGTGSDDPAHRSDVLALKNLIRDVGLVKAQIEDEREAIGDVAGLVVLVGRNANAPTAATRNDISDDLDPVPDPADDLPFSPTWWEDQLADLGVLGFEVVAWDPRREAAGRNQFGELQGMARIREVLETHDWAAPEPDAPDDDLEEQLLGMDEGAGFNLEVNQLEREMLGLRMTVERGGEDEEEKDDDDRVETMDELMLRVQGIKDMSAELPENERKRFAARAVRDIMKEI